MQKQSMSILSSSPAETAGFAKAIGQHVQAGDTLLLDGPVGAGKTHFARHLIQSLLVTLEDVPSPTFTLVQTYETIRGPLWHADLYRVTSVYEIEELGLTDAFSEAICIVEWPGHLGELTPPAALYLNFEQSQDVDTRKITAHWTDEKWTTTMSAWNVA